MNRDEALAYIDSLRVILARDRWRSRGEPTLWVVLHSMEIAEMGSSAEACANYFANPGDRTASTQFTVDVDSTVRCAELDDIVAGAVGANHKGVHIEQAGFAAQSHDEWRDPYSTEMIRSQTAPLVAALCVIYGLPVEFVKADGLRAGVPGVTTHAECWKAFGGDYRSDPGDNYPVADLLGEVRAIIEGDNLMPIADDILAAVNNLAKSVADLRAQVQATHTEDGQWEQDTRRLTPPFLGIVDGAPEQWLVFPTEHGLRKLHVVDMDQRNLLVRLHIVGDVPPVPVPAGWLDAVPVAG